MIAIGKLMKMGNIIAFAYLKYKWLRKTESLELVENTKVKGAFLMSKDTEEDGLKKA